MKTIIIVVLSMLSAVSAYAGELNELDRFLLKDYITPRQQKIQKIQPEGNQPSQLWNCYYQRAADYSDFNVDSALNYIRMAESIAPDSVSYYKTQLRRASIYNGSLMMYKEASDIFDRLPAIKGDTAYSKEYYTVGVQLYKNLQEQTPDADLSDKYGQLKISYRDSVLAISPDAILIRANQLLDQGRSSEVLKLLLAEVQGAGFSAQNGAVYHEIAKAYRQQGNTAEEIHYLTLAAESDIVNGVREYAALPRLAYLLYCQGDVDRAYRYMQRSIDDAKACNARVRLFDMSETMSVISGAHAAKQRQMQIWMVVLAILLFLMLIVVGVSLYDARRRNRLLQQSQQRLSELNKSLELSGSIREKYGRRFMRLSLGFVESLDHYRLQLLKVASRRKFDELYDAISSTSTVERESEVFYHNFDTAFLELYPDFIDQFNSLLRPMERITLDDDGKLNTELRIFALMKLGITESAEIAKLLRCSQSTVYNYRTRYRAKAIDRDEFDRAVFG